MTKICVLIDENNRVIAYGICLSKEHIPLENGAITETDLDLDEVDLVGNYKLIDGELIELTGAEKSLPVIVDEIIGDEEIAIAEAIIDLHMEIEELKSQIQELKGE